MSFESCSASEFSVQFAGFRNHIRLIELLYQQVWIAGHVIVDLISKVCNFGGSQLRRRCQSDLKPNGYLKVVGR